MKEQILKEVEKYIDENIDCLEDYEKYIGKLARLHGKLADDHDTKDALKLSLLIRMNDLKEDKNV